MKNGLYDISIVSFVFAPLVLTVIALLCVWWVRSRDRRSTTDLPGLLLAAAVSRMPVERRDWGAAMTAELNQLQALHSRWCFALGCARVALFPPRAGGRRRSGFGALTGQVPICGVLSVALPPLALPFLYIAAVILEAIGGSPFTSSRWSNPDAVIAIVRAVMLGMFLCLMAGLPLGIAGLFRRERSRWLSVMGPMVSLCTIGYVLVVMHFLAGAD